MTKLAMAIAIGTTAMLSAACGEVAPDGDLCGTGTFIFNGECVNFDPDDTVLPTSEADPPGGVRAAAPSRVVLRASERAMIYYTTDGSEPTTSSSAGASTVVISDIEANGSIKFFAVDAAGNTEAINTETYSVDDAAPGPVTGLTASATATDTINVNWSNPPDADLAGVMLVRSIGDPAPFVPEFGRVYAVGDEVGPGQIVVFVGAADAFTDAFTDAAALPGFNQYSAHAFDGVNNYAGAVNAIAEIVTDSVLQASLSVQLSPLPQVAVTLQPANVLLTATAKYDFDNSQLTVTLTMENRLARLLNNPKAVVTALSQGALANPASVPRSSPPRVLRIAGNPFVYYGPQAIGILGSVTRDLVFSGIDGSIDPVQVDLDIVSHPMLVTGESSSIRVGDSFPSGFHARIGCALGNNGSCQYTEAAYNKIGSKLFLSDGRTPSVIALDMGTFLETSGASLAPKGFIDSVVVSPDGQFVYAVLNTNTHRSLNDAHTGVGTDVFLVKLDAFSLQEIGRVALTSNSTGMGRAERARGHRLSVTADGKFGAMAVKNVENVYHIDLEQMALLRVIDVRQAPTDGGPSPHGRVRYAAIRPDNSEIYVAYRDIPTKLDIIRIANNYAVTPLPMLSPPSSYRPGDLQFGPDGRLYLSRKQVPNGFGGLVIFDRTNMTEKSLLISRRIYAIDFSPDGSKLYASDQGGRSIRVFDVASDTEIDVDGNAANGITAIPSGSHRAHSTAISPR